MHLAKQKFFRSVNAIFGKIGTQRNSGVVLSLINSFCIPVLLYGLEAFSLKQSNVNKINSLLNTVYSKVFNVRDNQTILECQFYSGQLPLSYILDLKTLNFHKSLITVPNSLSYVVNKLTVSDDISKICLRYDISSRCVSGVHYGTGPTPMRVPLLCGGPTPMQRGPLLFGAHSHAGPTPKRVLLRCGRYSRSGPTPMRMLLPGGSHSDAGATTVRVPLRWLLLLDSHVRVACTRLTYINQAYRIIRSTLLKENQ